MTGELTMSLGFHPISGFKLPFSLLEPSNGGTTRVSTSLLILQFSLFTDTLLAEATSIPIDPSQTSRILCAFHAKTGSNSMPSTGNSCRRALTAAPNARR